MRTLVILRNPMRCTVFVVAETGLAVSEKELPLRRSNLFVKVITK